MSEKTRILFVDDEPMILTTLQRGLRDEGFELYFTSDPYAVVGLVHRHRIDILVSDHVMPEMTGVDVLALIRQLFPETIRIMLTAHADHASKVKLIDEANVFTIIDKPWDERALRTILHDTAEALKRRRSGGGEGASAR